MDVYKKLEEYTKRMDHKIKISLCIDENINKAYQDSLNDWQRFRPEYISSSLIPNLSDLVTTGDVPILDDHLMIRARDEGKIVKGIETAAEFNMHFDGLRSDLKTYWLNVMLDIDTEEDTEFMIRCYRYSLDDALEMPEKEHHKCPESELMAYVKTHIMDNRNKKMAERIDNLLRNEPNHHYFFAFGNAHFLGEDSVVDLLQQNGYKVTRVE